jgi:hypothetical protein
MRRILSLAGLVLTSAALLFFLGCGGGTGGYGGGGGNNSSGGGTSGIATKISISPDTASITMTGTQQFTAVSMDANGNTLTGVPLNWASSNTAVATVSATGMASAVGTGTTSITASVTYSSGGSYSSPGNGTTYTSNKATLTVTTMDAVAGMVATGHALPGALITMKDATGKGQVTESSEQGRFSVSTAGLKGPFLIKADDGRGHVLFGTAAKDGGVNVTPVTDLMVRTWFAAHGSTPEAAFADMSAHPAPDAKSLSVLDRNFAGLLDQALTAEGLDSRHFSLSSTSFNADSTGFDAVLDHVSVVTGSHLQLQDGLGGRTTDIGFSGKTVSFSTQGADDAAAVKRSFDLP